MRQFVRHPSDMHIDIATSNNESDKSLGQLHDLSYGGICCHVEHFIPSGTHVIMHIPSIQTQYEGHGTSAWCRRVEAHDYEIGISFDDESNAFNYRMVEQVCLIEQYRKQIFINEGRTISSEQAAAEWITLFAAEFSNKIH